MTQIDAPSQKAIASTQDPRPEQQKERSASPETHLISQMEIEEATTKHVQKESSANRNRQWYGVYRNRDLIFEKTVDLQGTLLNCKVNPMTRAQMLDWMIEVLSNLNRQFSEATFFRSAQLMDMYFKLSKTPANDNQVHLIGLTCMYIASKYEDVEPMRTRELSIEAAYGKFSTQQIRQMEVQILHAIRYQVSFKTHLEVLDFFYYRVFVDCPSEQSERLRDLARNFCILVLANVGFNDYDVRYVVLSCMINAGAYLEELATAEHGKAHLGKKSHFDKRQLRLSTKSIGAVLNNKPMLQAIEAAKVMRGYLEQETRRGGYPVEIWQLVEFTRNYLKRFKKDFAVCGQMCRLADYDVKMLFKE